MLKNKRWLYNIVKYCVIFAVGAAVYMTIEILYRGFTHWTMGVLGGISLILIGIIDELTTEDLPLLVQAPLASIIITLLEYYAGCILNLKLGMDIWDYSELPLNVDGQVCIYFSLAWMVLGMVAVVIDNLIRHYFFGEPMKDIKLI